MVKNARRSNGQSHHNTGINDAPRYCWEFLDHRDDCGHPEGDAPGDGLSAGRRPPQSHAKERRKQVVEGIVPLDRPNDEREGALDHQRGEFFVKALVALGVGKEQTAECVQAPLDRGQN